MKKDISKAITKLLDYNQAFAFKGDFTMIHSWIEQGCDLEKDILPAFDEMMQRNKNITSVSYFAPCVMKKRDNRLALEQAIQTRDIPPANDSDAIKARGYALKLRKFKMGLNGLQEAFLNEYEAKHGRIAV